MAIKIGSHVSMSAPKYVLGSVIEALEYKANALMLYTGAPQNSFRAPIEKLNIDVAVKMWKENGNSVEDIIVHAPYIINLANVVKEGVFESSVEILKKEILRTKAIGAKYLVLHPGSYVSATLQQGIDSIIAGLNEAIEDDEVIIALETMAGKGSEVGFKFEQLKQIMDNVNHPLAVCLDSCHIWDAGYDLNNLDDVLNEFDNIIGLDKLKVLHINDSKNVCGSRKDRHANIGKGEIGFDILHKIVHHPSLQGKTMILETPWIDGKAPYKQEIELLRNDKK